MVTKWKIVIKVPNHNQYFEKNKLFFFISRSQSTMKRERNRNSCIYRKYDFQYDLKMNWMEDEISMEFSIFHE